MKRKILLTLFVLLLCSAIIPSVYASKPVRPEESNFTQVLDGPFNGFYAKGVVHSVLVGRYIESYNATHEVVRVKMNLLQKFNAYELVGEEPGDFYGTANMAYEYSGIILVAGVEPDVVMTMWAGILAGTWVFNFEEADIPEGSTYKGHITAFYEEGVIVKEITKGVAPFPIP